MKEFNEKLKDLKIDDIKAPEELEDILKGRLEGVEREERKKRKFYNNKLFKSVAAFALVILIFNFNTVSAAFKKLIGYEEYFSYNTYIEKLNSKGELQNVDEKIILSDGNYINIEAILYDGMFMNIFTRDNIPREEGDEYPIEIKVKGGHGNSRSQEVSEDGDVLSVEMVYAGENLSEVVLQIYYKDEAIKEILVPIDKDKDLAYKILEKDDTTIEVDNIKVNVNNIRVSPLAIVVDYSVTSENEEKMQSIKSNSGGIVNQGISIRVWVEGKNLDVLGVLDYDEKIELENGIRFKQHIFTNDLRIDRVKKLSVNVYAINESEGLGFDFKDGIENLWVNDDLYIESAYYEDGRMGIKFWSRNINKNVNMPKYQIFPYEAFYNEGPSKERKKKLFGKDYKEFTYMHLGLTEENVNSLFKIENKIYKIPEEDRKIEYKINYNK